MDNNELIKQARGLCDSEFNAGRLNATLMRKVYALTDALEAAQKEIERLKTQCDINATSFFDMRNMQKEATARAEKSEAENRWIPVGERLPKTEKPVQVYMPKLYMPVQTGFYTKYYGEDGGEWYEHWVASGDVTHWRPLPEPPKGEQA